MEPIRHATPTLPVTSPGTPRSMLTVGERVPFAFVAADTILFDAASGRRIPGARAGTDT